MRLGSGASKFTATIFWHSASERLGLARRAAERRAFRAMSQSPILCEAHLAETLNLNGMQGFKNHGNLETQKLGSQAMVVSYISIQAYAPDDFLGNGQRSGGGGAGGVDDMERSGFLDQVEILEKRAVARHGLGTDARTTWGEVLGADFGDEFLEGFGEKLFAERPAAFVPRHRGVAAEEIPEAGEGKNFGSFAGVDVGFAVSFAGEGEDCVWPSLDAAVDESGEVDSEEGKCRVGHGVDEVADEVARFGGEFEILAAEGDDTDVVFCASERGDAVAEEAGAVYEVAAFEFACGGLEDPAAEVVVDGRDAGVFLEGAAEALDFADERVADGLVIDDAFLWNAQCCEAGGVGFDFSELGGIEPLNAFEAVLLAARFQFAEAGDFGFVGGDDDLPADFMGDSMLAAEFGHEPNPVHGESGLQRTGLVIEAAVEDAAVVRALVAAGSVFFFKDADRRAWFAEQQLAGDCEAHNTAANNEMVLFFQHSSNR